MKRLIFFTFGIVALIGLGIFWQKNEKSAESQTTGKASFRAMLITDIDHCPSRVPVNQEHLQRFLDAARASQADFLASLGDNASHRLSECSKTADIDARFIADLLRSAGLPAYFLLGDHDIASSVSSYEAWLATSGRNETYYSFDVKDVHVVILDTVLGGDPLSPACGGKESCRKVEEREKDLETLVFMEYQKKYPDSLADEKKEERQLKNALDKEEEEIALTRSFGKRDKGRLLEKQLRWLEEDLKKNEKKKILVLSDHPIFHFVSSRKTYDIEAGPQARVLLEEEERKGKEVAAISGEAHLWHEEEQNGVEYYIVDEFRKAGGSWAHISWPQEGFRFEKITH